MGNDWTADVVGRMFVAGITGKQLAAECGWTNEYISSVLHGRKGNSTTHQKIVEALVRLEQKSTKGS